MKKKTLTQLLLVSVVCITLYFFCSAQTKNFRIYFLLSNLPNDPKWEVPPLCLKEQRSLEKKLKQKFYYLGSGGWCFAFLGEDKRTVLKFYKHIHLQLPRLLKERRFKDLLFKGPSLPQKSPYFQAFNFESCRLMYMLCPERSALIYVHLNKTENQFGKVHLIDPIGVDHVLDLDRTEFVVQEKATCIIEEIESLMQQELLEVAQERIQEMLFCLKDLYSKGLEDQDASFRKNFGFVEGKAVAFDLSSFTFNPSLQNQASYKKEIAQKTQRLARHLRKYYPSLYETYQKELEQL